MGYRERTGESPAQTDTESRLSAIWTEVLGQDKVSRDSRFTDHGGHSLALVRLIARVYEVFSVTLSLAEVLEDEPLRDLAQRIDQRLQDDPSGKQSQIPLANKDLPVPLSHTQEHLLVESLKAPDVPAYNEVATIRFNGAVEEDRLALAINRLVDRHDCFRTSYEWEEDSLRQVIHQRAEVVLASVDFRKFDEAEREAMAEAHANEWAAEPFNLKKPPLIRTMLGWFSDDDARLFIVAHHLAIDAQTLFGIVLHDLWAFYSALESGKPAQLDNLRIQYPDYAVWQKEAVQQQPDGQLEYWVNKLEGFQPTNLPDDGKEPGTNDKKGHRTVFHLSPELSRNVKLLALDSETTPFVVLLSAFKSLLHHRTGAEDITVGSVTSAREHPDTQHVGGCFLNFLPLRTKCAANTPFRELVASVGETLHEAIAHQEVPLSSISEALRRSGDLGRQPVYRIMFLLEPPREKEPAGWSVDQLSFHPGAAKLDLTVEMDEAGGRFFGRVEYRTDFFSEIFIEDLIRQYRQVLEQAVTSPEMLLSAFKLVSEGESDQVLKSFNRSEHSVKSHYRLHDFMEERAVENPDSIALEYLEQRFTYADLKRYSDNIALLLHDKGVQRNDVVAVVTRRSIWLPVALFGILKSGAAYLPIDPDQPTERVRALLEDSQAKIILSGENVDLGQVSPGVTLLDITEAAQIPASGPPPDPAQPGDLAYVLYTSGSTGKPKGAMIEHRSIVNRLLWMAHEYAFDETDVQLQKTPITFDVSLHELFLWSFVGARLAIPPPGVERDPAELIRSVQAHRVTQTHFVPSMLDVFLTYLAAFGNEQTLFTLRHVHCSGEALPPASVEKFRKLVGRPLGIGLHNLYGPTEAAVDVSYFDCSQFSGGSSVPIGKPVWNTQLYVLDANRQPVPVGSRGELYIGGIQVGRGYLNRPDLTREAFVPDPFTNDQAARLYRTGDQARWLPDGNLEYLGRNDFQIKIRGVRIEPAEIEAAIRDFSGVTAAACIAKKSPEGEVTLLGYYSGTGDAAADSEGKIMDHLKTRLPSQMIPASLTRLESFPLNNSGKLDRKALPDPIVAKRDVSRPLSVEERILADAWEAVLKVEGLGPDADFFAYGGDSIQAIQVISKIRQKGYLLNLRHMFDCVCLADAAAEMQPIGSAGPRLSEKPARSGLVPIQNWFFGLHLSAPFHWNQSRLIEFSGPVEAPPLQAALRAVIANHDSLRLRFRQTPDGWIQELNPVETPLELETINQKFSNSTEADFERRCAELQASLDIHTGPVIKAAFWEGADGQSGKMFICIHHLVTDGISWQIILEDLESAYPQIISTGQARLPGETTSYLQWPALLGTYHHNNDQETAVQSQDHTCSRIADIIPGKAGPEENLFSSAREVRRTLSAGETQQLLMEVPSCHRTEMNDILLTALALFFKSAGCRESVVIFLEGHGREPVSAHADLGRTTGWFTSLFPVTIRTDFIDTDSALRTTMHNLRAIPGKGLDYGLKHYFGDSASEGRADRPEFLFNYLGNTDRLLEELSLIRTATPLWQSECAKDDERPWIHEMLSWIENGQLTVAWYFSETLHQETAIVHLLESYIECIRTVIRHCLTNSGGGNAPEDFKSSGLSQDELDDLYSDFKNINA